MKKYTEVFKRKIAHLHINNGESVAHLAKKYGVSRTSIYKWIESEKFKYNSDIRVFVITIY